MPETDPIQKAVDEYIEMERKAKAWDILLTRAKAADTPITGVQLVGVMVKIVEEVVCAAR